MTQRCGISPATKVFIGPRDDTSRDFYISGTPGRGRVEERYNDAMPTPEPGDESIPEQQRRPVACKHDPSTIQLTSCNTTSSGVLNTGGTG